MITRRRALLLGAAPAAGALLAGCASVLPQTAALRADPAHAPTPVELDAVPFFAQTRDHCGPAALATVLVHLGRQVTPDALGDEVFLPSRAGSLQTEMLAAPRRHGALGVAMPGQLRPLLAEVSDGRPVVVLLNLAFSIAPLWHYAVLVGHDVARDELILRSGTERRLVVGFTPFEHTWARAGRWAFVVVAPGELPLGASEADVVQAGVGFERVAPPRDALRVWQSVAQRWPASEVAAIGIGTTLHAAGERAAAVDAFEAAARRHASGAAWINAGEVALELGQRERAVAAARAAIALGGRWQVQAGQLAARAAR